jgi:pyridoxine/pyridoxamine 5'-phosphate oxidase
MTSLPRTDLGPFSGSEAIIRPWAHTVDAIRRLQKFTLCTVRADGRPHATPLLAVWAMNGMNFTTGKHEQKARNLARNPKCILTAGTNTLTGDDYVIEGSASLVSDEERLASIATAFEQTYGWHLTREDGTWHGMANQIRSGAGYTYFVQPSIIFAFGNGEPFSQTRYHFD